MNFEELVHALKQGDDCLLEDLDPSVTDNLMDKIDSIKYVIDRLHRDIAFLGEEISNLQSQKKKLEKNLDYLEYNVARVMLDQAEDQLPGKSWILKLRPNPPKVVTAREPSKEDWLEAPGAVSMKVSYSWDKKAIKEALQNCSAPQVIRDIAHVEQNYTPVFAKRSSPK